MTEKNNTKNLLNSIGKKIVISFHEQFAQNQNHHQKLFLQVLAVLLTVLVGYGYIYIRVGAEKPEFNITIETLYAFLPLLMCLLSMASALICNMALGFRRDQLMAVNIRMIANVMRKTNEDGLDSPADYFFFDSYNPQDKIEVHTWMPEFHMIFFLSLIILKIIFLYGAFALECVHLNYVVRHIGTILFIFASIILDVYVFKKYQNKWKRYAMDPKLPAHLKK